MKKLHSKFNRARHKAGLIDKSQAAEFFGVTLRTIDNWDKKGAPLIAMRLLLYWDRWDCTAHGPEWAGFRFSRGRLVYGRERLIFTPQGLKSWPLLCEQIEQLERQERTRKKCPVMGAWQKIKRLIKPHRH